MSSSSKWVSRGLCNRNRRFPCLTRRPASKGPIDLSAPTIHRSQELTSPEQLLEIAPAWNALAERAGSPFLTAEWLAAWWNAFDSDGMCLVLRDEGGDLRAGVCMQRAGGRLLGMANDHSGDWDAVAADDLARNELWRQVGARASNGLMLPSMKADRCIEEARGALEDAGYSTTLTPAADSPLLALPPSWEDLLGGVSRGMRSQLGRKRRRLEREGALGFRTTYGGERLDRDLDALLSVEASGWKSRSGTAILSSPRTTRLYRDVAHGFARAGWLRIHVLELDERVIAAALGCTFAGASFLIKTAFDERFAEFSPGLILQGDALRASIAERSRSYDFLGRADSYKLRWGAEPRTRVTMRAFKGWRRPVVAYYRWLRPPLRAAAIRVRSRFATRSGG